MAALTERLSCGAPKFHIDFMSLDVEGAELEVMTGWDWDRVTIGVLMAETSNMNNATRHEFDKLVLEKGNLKVWRTERIDTWYVSPYGADRRKQRPPTSKKPKCRRVVIPDDAPWQHGFAQMVFEWQDSFGQPAGACGVQADTK
eukprot:Hpha_TRINITY_DN1109_c0_g1::TRINITY_DN1109_c0_g1_i1::g.113066::m.113066